MSKIKVKNSLNNQLMLFLKQNNIKFEIKKHENNRETVHFFPMSENNRLTLLQLLQTYGNRLYHDCILKVDFATEPVFNYLSNEYENITYKSNILNLPVYYVENLSEQNKQYTNFKVIDTNKITKKYITDIAFKQNSLITRTPQDRRKMRNIYFDKSYNHNTSLTFLNEFCYYNKISFKSYEGNSLITDTLHKLNFCKETLQDFADPTTGLTTEFFINDELTDLITYDLLETLRQSDSSYDKEDKLILSDNMKDSNFMENNLKKTLLINNISNSKNTKGFSEIFHYEKCKTEYVLYKIEKFIGEETNPVQTIWCHDKSLKHFYDYQIKLGELYRYKISSYVVIYGTSSSVIEVKENKNSVSADFSFVPSYRIAEVAFGENRVKNLSNPQMPPYVKFMNESSATNKIKIYLDLKNAAKKSNFIEVRNTDSDIISNIKRDEEGKIQFEYQIEDGKFEVFRLAKKPKEYIDFENAKVLEVRNKISSTSVVFNHDVMPNKKYYYMFRSINISGVPSNPTPVYEIELIKDASSSKIVVNTISMEPVERPKNDKKFKSLLQITPAFEQAIFDDLQENITDMDTFKKKINNLPLGVADDKVWGKKFKVRVKSKDTGKIVDLNIKFNLVKDNIK